MDNIYEILKLDHLGRGIVKVNGKTVFILHSTIGDIVKIKIIKENKKYSIGVVKEFVKKSELRKNNYCPYSDICGGCSIGNLIYEEQLKYKEEKIKNIFDKYLKQELKINPIIYANDLGYRNKITLHVRNKKVGLYKEESNEIIEIEKCILVSENINKLIERVRLFIKNTQNDIEKVTIRYTNKNESMINFIGSVDLEEVKKYFSDITSIVVNNKIIGEKYITEELGKYNFKMSYESFFQVNRFNTINLYNEVYRILKEKKYKKLLDLYCGTGTITIFNHEIASEVVGIEQVKTAIDAANINKNTNNITNIKFIDSKVDEVIDQFNDIDCIITDPPRSGMDNKTIDNIIRINPKDIIYVSCDPMTLVRDLNRLSKYYLVKEITPVDMFPNTYHVETVCVLERR